MQKIKLFDYLSVSDYSIVTEYNYEILFLIIGPEGFAILVPTWSL